MLAVLVGMPFALVGILLCFTLIGIPLGLALIALSGVPLAWVQHRQIRKKVHRAFHEDLVEDTTEGEVPWEL